MKFIITGGAGFIGSNIAAELIKQSHEVKIIDDLSYGFENNLDPIKDKITFVKADIRDLELLKKEFKGFDYVLHLAALRSVPKSMDDPESFHDVNINGHRNVLEASRLNKIKRVVFASSSSVYGDNLHLPQQETQEPMPISPYAITKLVGERYNHMYWKVYKLPVVSLRYFNVFGPRQSLESQYAVAIPKFITCLMNGEAAPIFGNGEQTRDFTFVKNVIDANLAACNAPAEKVGGQVINIANGASTTVNELFKKIQELVGKDTPPEYKPVRAGDVLHTRADPSKAEKLMGFKCSVNIDEGLKETVEWFKEHGN